MAGSCAGRQNECSSVSIDGVHHMFVIAVHFCPVTIHFNMHVHAEMQRRAEQQAYLMTRELP